MLPETPYSPCYYLIGALTVTRKRHSREMMAYEKQEKKS